MSEKKNRDTQEVQRMDKIMAIPRQYKNTIVCVAALKERYFEYLSLFVPLLTLCSASGNALKIVFSNSSFESTAKRETCRIFKQDRLLVRI